MPDPKTSLRETPHPYRTFNEWAINEAHCMRYRKLFNAVQGRQHPGGRLSKYHLSALRDYVERLVDLFKRQGMLPKHPPLRRVILNMAGKSSNALDLLRTCSKLG